MKIAFDVVISANRFPRDDAAQARFLFGFTNGGVAWPFAMVDPPFRYDPSFAARRCDERYLDDKSREAAREFRSGLEHIMASGKSDGMVRPGPAELWAGVWLALVGYAMWRVSAAEWAADHPQTQLTLEAAWDAIALRGGAAPPLRT